MNKILPRVDRKLYPELDLILWGTVEPFVSASDAFSAYEKRWRYVDQTRFFGWRSSGFNERQDFCTNKNPSFFSQQPLTSYIPVAFSNFGGCASLSTLQKQAHV